MYHYFASSVASWATDTDLEGLRKGMQREGFPFVIWQVPGAEDIEYDIRGFKPQVEGAIVIERHGIEERVNLG